MGKNQELSCRCPKYRRNLGLINQLVLPV